MRKIALATVALFVLAILAGGAQAEKCLRAVHIDGNSHLNGVEVDFEDGSIVLTSREYEKETVEITKDYQLYINDHQIDLDENQQELVKEYYDLFDKIVEDAKELGWEGARIGVSGAKLGLSVIGGLFKVVFTSYDTDDFERDVEREADRLEARAKVLERKAKVIEKMAEDLEDVAEEMSREIPQLGEMGWF